MKKILLPLLLLAIVFAFAACTNGAPAPAEPPADSVEEAAVAGLQMDRVVLGTNAQFPPFEFVADEGEGRFDGFSGIDIAIGMRIADALGAELVIHDSEFAGLIADLNAGTIDFIAAAMTIRPDRMNNVHFSIPYFTAMQYIVVPIDSPVEGAADLDGKRVGVQLGTTGEFFVQDYVDAEMFSYNMIAQGFMEMLAGTIDAVVVDSLPAIMFAYQHPDALRIVRDIEAFSSEHYGIAVRHADTELLAVINSVLSDMLASGEIDELFVYYSERLQ